MSTHAHPHPLKHRLLRHAHDTQLWASYRPRVPAWAIALALAGGALVAVALALVPSGQPVGRALLILASLLLVTPVVALAAFVRQSRRRRAAARQRILDAVPWRGDEAVLDVGCGSGMLLNGAARRLTTGLATGIDIWAAHSGGGSLELLTRHARLEGVADRIDFQEADARQMPFEDASFDVVLSSWALHHITHSREDFEAAVGEMLRVLKPGGTLVVLDVAHMVEALALRMERANLQVSLEVAPLGQKMVIGRRPAAPPSG